MKEKIKIILIGIALLAAAAFFGSFLRALHFI